MTRTAAIAFTILALAYPMRAFGGCQPGNLIDNCGFPTSITGWTTTSGVPSHDPASGSSALGSLQVVGSGVDITFHQCADVSGVTRPLLANYGIDYRDGSANDIETLSVSVTDFSDPACTSGNETGNSSNASDGVTSTSYEQVSGTYTIGATAQGVLFRVNALRFSSTITGHFDDAFLGENVVPVELISFGVD